jgi:hypothetical protein
MDEFCGKCGKNLTEMGRYSDFVHRIPGTESWCLTLEELYGPEAAKEARAGLEVYATALADRLAETLNKIKESK